MHWIFIGAMIGIGLMLSPLLIRLCVLAIIVAVPIVVYLLLCAGLWYAMQRSPPVAEAVDYLLGFFVLLCLLTLPVFWTCKGWVKLAPNSAPQWVHKWTSNPVTH